MQVRPTQIQYVDEDHKRFAGFCNTLRCPLCGSQLDGLIHKKKARLYCASNNEEYKVHWMPNEEHPDLEILTFWYTQYMYSIVITKIPTGFQTVIGRYNMDAHPSKRASTRKVVFECNERVLFFRKRMEEKEFLNKLKLYNVFS